MVFHNNWMESDLHYAALHEGSSSITLGITRKKMCNEQEIDGKFRQFNRVLMSYVDFQQAHEIASMILEENLHEQYPDKSRIRLEALNASMVVAYCRPFSGNRGVPDLPKRFLRNLTEDERKIHNVLMADRNTVIAHSDPEAWNMRPHYQLVNGKNILIPLHHGVHRPFLREPTERIRGLSEKQMETCFSERVRLEQELRPHMHVAKNGAG